MYYSTFGKVQTTERLLRTKHCSYIRVLPEHLGISDKGCTKRLQRAISDFGLERSFAGAIEGLEEHYGFTLPVSTAAKITLEHASIIATKLDEREHSLSLPKEGVETIIAEADGSFVPIVSTTGKHCDKRKNREINYQEARLCACQSKGSSQIFYESTFEDVDQVGQLWSHCAKAAGRGLNTEIHCIADGASWIAKQAYTHLKPKRYLVDFYHACEYLAGAQPTCATNARWMSTQKKRLKSNHPQRVLAALKPHIESHNIEDTKAPVRAAHRYFQNRLNQLDYAGAIQEELPIGSGMIESGHKHVLQARLKISGAAWTLENAQNMAKARALKANQGWEPYWN